MARRPSTDPRGAAEWLCCTGEPTRLEILRALALSGEMRVIEIAKVRGTDSANASHHLTALKNARILNSECDGHFQLYRLVAKTALVTATHLTLTRESGIRVEISLG
jgi:DNA-binding transcriptional ArsR family regulator